MKKNMALTEADFLDFVRMHKRRHSRRVCRHTAHLKEIARATALDVLEGGKLSPGQLQQLKRVLQKLPRRQRCEIREFLASLPE